MNINLSPALDVLYDVEIAQEASCHRICELLSLDPASTISQILTGGGIGLGVFDANFLEIVAKIVKDHNIKRNITDWPFEHFWGNPYEPLHSKLLEYFIDPNATHGCGSFLLGKLFGALKDNFPSDFRFVVENYRVSQPNYIDLLIERDCDDGNEKYAIIIENKINWARDPWQQLQTYVRAVIRRGFKPEQIFVFYLPLTAHKDPNQSDVNTITKKLHVKYAKITFEKHILNWLESVLANEADPAWPPGMRDGMLENITHYRNLIRYLVNKQKESKMNHEILKQLEMSEGNKLLPTWSQVAKLQQSATDLKQCIESVIRGKMLLKTKDILRQQGENAWLCLEEDVTKEIKVDSPYDEQFGVNIDLCISTNGSVNVCFGAGPYRPGEEFWIGYTRRGSNKQEKLEQIIISEARGHLKSIVHTNDPWYFWDYRKDVTYDNCMESSPRIAQKMLDMRNGLMKRFKGEGIRF